MNRKLISTISGKEYPFERLEESSENGESLEVRIEGIENAKIKEGDSLWERFADFLPFTTYDKSLTLGEGNTPLLQSNQLSAITGLTDLWIKNETLNPTWSFKDRGSLACILMAKEMGEESTATISTGNMGASIAAYAARADIKAMIFIPSFCPEEKIRSMSIHGAKVYRVDTADYGLMKKEVLKLSEKLGLRVVSGNGPIRTEGYKLTAFELYEQFKSVVPDYVAVPTSACGHIRGIFKGYKELFDAGLITKLPKMIIVQAKNNSPIVSAWKSGSTQPLPFTNVSTIAEAITTGNPLGGDEILVKAYKYGWLAEDAEEEEILEAQIQLGSAGFFVEPSSATVLAAVRKLRESGKIDPNAKVTMILTGSGLKDSKVFAHHKSNVIDVAVQSLEHVVKAAF